MNNLCSDSDCLKCIYSLAGNSLLGVWMQAWSNMLCILDFKLSTVGVVAVFSLSMYQFFIVLGKNDFLTISVFGAYYMYYTFSLMEFLDRVLVWFLSMCPSWGTATNPCTCTTLKRSTSLASLLRVSSDCQLNVTNIAVTMLALL